MINSSSSSSSSDSEDSLSPPTSTMEETSSLVAAVNNNNRRKRVPTRGSSVDCNWKPSLFAIAEDNAVSATLKKPVNRQQPVSKVVSQRNVKRCASSPVEVNARSRSHDFSREPLPMVFPAFSAAPFMF
ncbi:hypothetical protein SOVF_198780 [Spinacia oleracea]|nr:hypothetical protein SOVF_198780 [Spinacia oleracea]